MRVRCLFSNGEAYKSYKMPSGYLGTSQFGVEVGKEYIVMGISLSEGLLLYLIDHGGVPQFCPFQLFEVIDGAIADNWYFRAYTNQSEYYPYRQAIWGYYELCFDDSHWDKLADGDEEAVLTYFRRKIETENAKVE